MCYLRPVPISDDTFDKQAMEAYQSLLVLTIRDNSHTEVYQRFLDTLNETAARDFPEMTAVANYILFSTKHENRDTAVNEAIGAARLQLKVTRFS